MPRTRKKPIELEPIRTHRQTKEVDTRNETRVETTRGEDERLRKIRIPEGWLYILETYYDPGPHIGKNKKSIISTAMTFVPDQNLLSQVGP